MNKIMRRYTWVGYVFRWLLIGVPILISMVLIRIFLAISRARFVTETVRQDVQAWVESFCGWAGGPDE